MPFSWCPPNFTSYLGACWELANHRSKPVGWGEAQANCADDASGSFLAQIDNAVENDFLVMKLSGMNSSGVAWIGAGCFEGVWRWLTTGDAIADLYSNLAPQIQGKTCDSDHCLALRGSKGDPTTATRWVSLPCTQNIQWAICEQELAPTPAPPGPGPPGGVCPD